MLKHCAFEIVPITWKQTSKISSDVWILWKTIRIFPVVNFLLSVPTSGKIFLIIHSKVPVQLSLSRLLWWLFWYTRSVQAWSTSIQVDQIITSKGGLSITRKSSGTWIFSNVFETAPIVSLTSSIATFIFFAEKFVSTIKFCTNLLVRSVGTDPESRSA